ncbi:uncharacterized protein LOC130126598 isoform X2 [Lampris incognitus]|nr:uncharacterized protein LOC130126598 isoform X2 [Lampris incognitus]
MAQSKKKKKNKLGQKKRKKLQKKKNALKDHLAEGQSKSDSSDSHEENDIENNEEMKESASAVTGEIPDQYLAVGSESGGGSKADSVSEVNKEADNKSKHLDLNGSVVSTATKGQLDQLPKVEKKGEKKDVCSVTLQPAEQSSEVVEEHKVKKKKKKKKKKKNPTIIKEDLNLDDSVIPTTASTAEEQLGHTPKTDKKEKKKDVVLQPRKEKSPKDAEKNNEDYEGEDLAKRSAEFACAGNRFAAGGQFEMAVKCFTDAIKCNPTELKLYGNRSLCLERMQQYDRALSDAEIALSFEPNWVKGLFRKGKALSGLKRYHEASLVYKEVLKQNSSSAEATLEFKRTQTLHLMELGFTQEQSCEALKSYATLEEAVEALFGSLNLQGNKAGHSSQDNSNCPTEENKTEKDDSEGDWTVLTKSRPKAQRKNVAGAVGATRPNSPSPSSHSNSGAKPALFPVWVGSLDSIITEADLYNIFSRVGVVSTVKLLPKNQCGFVNFTRSEDCEKAIQLINGMVVGGRPLVVRYPNRIHPEYGASQLAKTDPSLGFISVSGTSIEDECFFWRTIGCAKLSCNYKHIPEHRNIDVDRVKSNKHLL